MDTEKAGNLRRLYEDRVAAIRAVFDANTQLPDSGSIAVRDRAEAVDTLIQSLWTSQSDLPQGVAIVAVGGYGRRELFPYSDVDLLFLLDARVSERSVKGLIRAFSQSLWDLGLRLAPMTRTLAECGRFNPENVEFTLSLLDARHVAGDSSLVASLVRTCIPKLLARDRARIASRLLDVTRTRHAKYGNTLFHLEPNVKECPGGLRDAHVCTWLARLAPPSESQTPEAAPPPEFVEAREFLLLVRTFLHFRHGRDDNTLDWQTQDEAAAAPLGVSRTGLDASYWMRLYFRHARAIVRRVSQAVEDASPPPHTPRLPSLRRSVPAHPGLELRRGRISFTDGGSAPDHDPDIVLTIFAAISRTGASLSRNAETRLEDALPRLSANLEDGPVLWSHLQAILMGPFAGRALRAMHAIGLLELVLPEFHGIDALVIRDAYHRYTVDEHTFVLIETLHALPLQAAAKAPQTVWPGRFGSILRDLPHPALLFLAALLHDTGKGHASFGHALESVRLAKSVLGRLEVDPYEAGLVLDLIRNHLEMSVALRRDVFDAETIRSFATHAPTPEALRMLTLFTYADIAAVHPNALTAWKAENLWRLYISTSQFLDRNVDDERISPAADANVGDVMFKVHDMLRARRIELAHFLEGLPLRYLQTRSADHIRAHFEMASKLVANETSEADSNPLDFRYAPDLSEITLVTRDRPRLFASMAGVLAAWGMNIITADAFSNAHGVVVDSFRFTDTFRTLELNDSERARFTSGVRDVMTGRADLAGLLATRRRTRRKTAKLRVEAGIQFDDFASTQSTLLQVVAQDTPGLLHALALIIAEFDCNIEVALIDTEGEVAIDVFYITHSRRKLASPLQAALREALLRVTSGDS